MRTILAYMNLHYKTSLERYQQFTKIKKKFWEKVASSGFNYKERKLVLTANKLFEHNFSTRMKIIYNVKYCYAIHLKFGDTFLTSLTKLVFELKASICSTSEEVILLYCRKFWAFVIVFMI